MADIVTNTCSIERIPNDKDLCVSYIKLILSAFLLSNKNIYYITWYHLHCSILNRHRLMKIAESRCEIINAPIELEGTKYLHQAGQSTAVNQN